MKLLLFQFKEKSYGIGLQQIRRIERDIKIRKLPQTPSFFKGIISMRGIIPVIDLNEPCGLILHFATDIINLDPSLIENIPSIARVMKENYIKGSVNIVEHSHALLS